MIFYLPEFFVQAFLRLVFSYSVDIGLTDFLEVGIQTNSSNELTLGMPDVLYLRD